MESCPLCGCTLNNTNNRLIEEQCGHKKCRNCFIQEFAGCKLCEQKSNILLKNANNSSPCTKNKIFDKSPSKNNKKYNGQLKLKTEWTILSKTTANDVMKNIHDDLSVRNINSNLEEKDTSKLCKPRDTSKIIVSNLKINKSKSNKKCNKFSLPSHITILETTPNTIYECTICKSKFKFKYHCKYHEACETGAKQFKCDTCSKEFKTLPHLNYHMKSHTEASRTKCDICGKQFSHIGSLNRHLKAHTSINAYQCELCTSSFKTKESLTAHNTRHKNETLFSCQKCEKRFNDKSNLRKHMMTHNLELKNYLCELCGKSFKIRWSLIAHKLAHTKSKFHKCSKCKSVFSSYPSLRRHYLSHSGKHYLCNYCDIKCQRKDNLIRHIRNTHPGKDTAYINNKLHKCVKRSLSYDKPIKKQIVFEMNKDKNKNSDKEDLVPNINTSNNILLDSNTIPHNSNKDPMDYSNGFSLQEKKFRIPVINGPIKLSFKNMQHSVNNVNSLNTSKNDNSKACEDHHIEIYRKILQAPSARKTLGSSTETSGSIESTFNNINETNTSKSLNGIDSLSDEQRKEYQHIEIYRKILMPSYTQKDKVDSNCYKSNTLNDHFTETQSPEKFHASILTSDNEPYTNYISSDKMGEINHKDYDNHVSTITLVAGNKIMCSLNEDVRTVPTMINL